MNKTIISILAVIILLTVGVMYRSGIKTFVTGGNKEISPSLLVSPSASTSASGIPSISSTAAPVSSKPAVYNGRPADEVRPVESEVKLFSESQKQTIYNSIQNYGKAVKENPDFFQGWLELGILKKNIGDFEGARDAWEYASVIRPANSVSFGNLGELYWRYLHQYLQAEMNWKMSIKNDPSNSGMYISLSGIYFYSMKEKNEFADDILMEGIEKNPQNRDLLKALARLYEQRNEYAKAIEWWQKALDKDPGDTSIAVSIEALKKKSGQ